MSGLTLVAAQRTMRSIPSKTTSPAVTRLPTRSSSAQAGRPSTWMLPRKRSGLTSVPSRAPRSRTDSRLIREATFACDVGEGEAGDVEHLRRPAQFVGGKGVEEGLDGAAARPRCARQPSATMRTVAAEREGRRARRRSGRRGRPAARSASASGNWPWRDGAARPGRSRTGRSRWRRRGRRGRSRRARAGRGRAAPAKGPSPGSGRGRRSSRFRSTFFTKLTGNKALLPLYSQRRNTISPRYGVLRREALRFRPEGRIF